MSKNKDTEQILEQKAKNILEYLKSNLRYDNGFLPRPFMIEFTGPPSAGKTTTIKELYDFLRPLGFRVWRPQEGAENIQDIPRTTPMYNIATAIYSLEKIIHESFRHTYDIILFDRALFDAYCWMEYWLEKEKLSLNEKGLLQSYFTFDFFTKNLDLVYFMICDSQVAIEREMRVALSRRPRETTTPASIESKVKLWQKVYKLLHPVHPNVRLVNTTEMNEQEMIEFVANDVLTVLEAKSKRL